MVLAEAPTERVKRDTTCISTTSNATLNLLRALLGHDLVRDENKIPTDVGNGSGTRKPQQRIPQSLKPPPRSGRPQALTTFAIYEALESKVSTLSLDAKRKVATETFNATLRNLSNAAKDEIKRERDSNVSQAGAIQSPKKPLVSCSPNRQARTDPYTKPTSHGNNSLSQGKDGLAATAECAVTALDCLYQLRDVDAQTMLRKKQDWRLERGGLILLDKLTTLGLRGCAMKKAVKAKVRLEKCTSDHEVSSTESPRDEQPLSDLPFIHEAVSLKFRGGDKELFDLATSYQSQAIRLAFLYGHSCITNSLLDALRLDSEGSPSSLLLQGVGRGFVSPDQAAKQLSTLSQALMKLCASKEDELSSHSSPELLLGLRTIALEIKCRSYDVLPGTTSWRHEIWMSLCRALIRYRDECKSTGKEDYRVAERAVRDLQNTMGIHENRRMPTKVLDIMADMASRGGFLADALTLLESQYLTLQDDAVLGQLVSGSKIAALRLGTWRENREATLKVAERTLGNFKGNLRGSKSELNDVLLHGARLRKAAACTVAEVETYINKSNAEQIDHDVQICAIRIIYAFLHLLLRYMRSQSLVAGTDEPSEKRQALESVSHKTVDAVLTVAKCSSAWKALLLDETVVALRECSIMAQLLEDQVPASSGPADIFVRLSGIFWSQFRNSEQRPSNDVETRHLLESATEMLANRSIAEQERGLLGLKYEKLTAVYLRSGMLEDAHRTLRLAITVLIRTGGLAEVAEFALPLSLQRVWSERSSKVCVLGRVLEMLVSEALFRTSTRDDHHNMYDDLTLPPLHRAVLLEKQVLACVQLPLTGSWNEQIVNASKEVIRLYSSPSLHVIRLRFICELLTTSSNYEQFPFFDIFEDCQEAVGPMIHEDVGTSCFLAAHGPTYQARVRLHWLFQTSRPTADDLDSVLQDLAKCVMAAEPRTSLPAFDDSRALCRQLNAVVDYAGMLDHKSIQVKALNITRKILESYKTIDQEDLIRCLVNLGALQSDLGTYVEAGRTLAVAESLLSRNQTTILMSSQFQVAFADYLLESGDTKTSSLALEAAGQCYSVSLTEHAGDRHRSRLKTDATLTHGALIASRLAFDQGDLQMAVVYGRQCVKLSMGMWLSMEKLWERYDGQTYSSEPDKSSEDLAEANTNLSVATDRSITKELSKGAAFWSSVQLHFKALQNISDLCAHSGLYQDAVFYAEQATRVAAKTSSDTFMTKSQLTLSRLYSNAAQYSLASASLRAVDRTVISTRVGFEACESHLDRTQVYLVLGQLDNAQCSLEQAKDMLPLRDPVVSAAPTPASIQCQVLSKAMSGLSVTESTLRTRRKPAGGPNQCAPFSVPSKTKPVSKESQGAATKEVALLSRADRLSFKMKIFDAKIALLRGDVATAISSLTPDTTSLPRTMVAGSRIVHASVFLYQALEAFTSDAVRCVLAETAIGLPSQHISATPTDPLPSTTRAVKSKAAIRVGRAIKERRPPLQSSQGTNNGGVESKGPEELLKDAHDLLVVNRVSSSRTASSDVVHKLHRLLAQASLLLHVVHTTSRCSAVQFVSQILAPKDVMRRRERWAVNAENVTSERSEVRRWPTSAPLRLKALDSCDTSAVEASGNGVLQDLPESWNVVALSLSEDKSELVVSRSSAGNTPFVLRLPLSRSGVEDMDDAKFSFQDAKDEITDIITHANLSAHDARGQGDKAARKAWWSEREGLDQRLEALLKNIENIWFGGFRGVLSDRQIDQFLLARFAESLTQILDKHLPSRQKTGIGLKVQLHAHVVGLFITLGHPGEQELDDSITDLLYFVIDILQFGGERNAYDEIDFDIIMLEVLDALRAYHEMNAPTKDDEDRHTIMILDKELHAFPWESLPCLQCRSVSRMPSLGAVQQRLDIIKDQEKDLQCYSISSGSGAYVLNPSSDLTSTQQTFASVFEAQLSNYTSIVNRIPTEKEFESCLSDNSLFLYFGHGSGSQYIRGRTIKKLEHCAVTFLMGCSSSKMVECGVYEPYGVPWNYMFAGAPAVVGTLWDVTDKDIDRFAMSTFTNWGLLDTCLAEDGSRGKEKIGRRKRVARGTDAEKMPHTLRAGQMALDEAVATARDSCVLRYLNGAAPVIYGVPIRMERSR